MPRQPLRSVALYVGWLFAAWTLYVAFVYPRLPDTSSLFGIALQESLRFGIFVAPLALILRSDLSGSLGISWPDRRGLLVGGIAGVVWAGASLAIAVWAQGQMIGAFPPLAFWLTGFTLATFVEEVAFRGYLLQALERHGAVLAVIVSSFLFVAIHIPGWALLGMMLSPVAWGVASGSIFALGCVLGVVFLKTRSVWPCVLVHALNNLAAALIA